MAIRNAAGVPIPLPADIMKGTLPVMAVIGAAVATAMNTTPTRPTTLGFSRATAGSDVPDPPERTVGELGSMVQLLILGQLTCEELCGWECCPDMKRSYRKKPEV
ncbi:hypothetical protein GCM10027262_52320 [Nocardia tengchongensis]